MPDELIPFHAWCDRLVSMDDQARWTEVETASYPSTAMILYFIRRSRSELHHSPTQALRWLDLAQRLWDRPSPTENHSPSSDRRWIDARLSHGRAAYYMIQGRLQTAHDLYLSALRGFEALDDAVFAATVKRGLLFALAQMGRRAEAVALGLEALAVFRRWRLPHDYFATMNNLGLVALGRGRLDRAEAIFSRLRRAALPDQPYYPHIFHNSILVRMERGDWVEAMADLGEFMGLCRAADNHIEAGRGLFMLGECLLMQGRVEEALDALSEAKTTLTALSVGFDSALINIYIAKALTQAGRPAGATTLLREAAEYFRREGYVTALQKLLDAWLENLAVPENDARVQAEEAFVFVRYFRRGISPPINAARPAIPLF